MLPAVQPDLEWASWIVTRRSAIEQAMAAGWAREVPAAASPEAEALRRFRSYVAAALRHGTTTALPALDGVHIDPERGERMLEAWCAAAVEVASARGAELRARLTPLAASFRAALAGGRLARHARRAPRVARRAVVAAIDRIADAYLAVDLGDGRVVDANPAAAALLRTPRETLVGAPALRFVHGDTRAAWEDQLAELVESDEPRRFRAVWLDALARPVSVELHVTRHLLARERPLALVVARVL